MSDVRINTRSPYYIEANPTEPTIPETPEVPDPPTNIPPTVTITASNTTPYAGDTVTLTAVATDSDGTIVSYLWGGTSSPQTTVSIDVTSTEVQSKIFNVAVTDDDGDVGLAQITINWQEIPEQTTNTDVSVACGDTFNQANFRGIKNYNLLVGDKVGDVTITFQDTVYSPSVVPVKFTLEWDGNTSSTGYIGDDSYNSQLIGNGVSASDINTSSPSNKTSGTTLTINKTAATPNQVVLTAQAVLQNDSYTFQLDCPDVEETITKFYTVKSTTAGGTTDFNYTDVNGDIQTISLEEGETSLISAQEDTVSVTSGTGTIEEGGQSFDLGVPEQDFDENVEVNIIFDDSGSMTETLKPLLDMADGILKDKLLSYYNNDIIKYNERVKVLKASDFNNTYTNLTGAGSNTPERFLGFASYGKTNATSTKNIYLFFTDETFGVYQSFSIGQRQTYFDDLALYRSYLNSTQYGEHFMRTFIIDFDSYTTDFLQKIFDGGTLSPATGFFDDFSGSNGLSDRSEASRGSSLLQNGVEYNTNPNYYYDFIIQALQDYGFNI